MKAYERLLKYAVIKTPSDESSDSTPSSACQFDLANLLKKEMEELVVSNIQLTDNCFLYGKLPATKGYENAPAIGFIAHMDTAPDFSGENVNPQIIPEYDGGDVKLGDSEYALTLKDFPHLASLKGRTLITTDGSTLLGADDKAGVAEIMTMAEQVITENIPHGKICIGFTPDEEVGCGVDFFDVEGFGADYAYTVDGGDLGELEYENFNAAGAKLIIDGHSVHPGSAKNKMLNAILLAQEFQNLLPVHENPSATDGYEGFYHPDSITGSVDHVVVDYIIRDHNMEKFEQKKRFFLQCADFLNAKYGKKLFTVDLKDSYYNMKEKILPENAHLIDNAVRAMEEAGVTPTIVPIRGGTDGARLSFMGLPCPNLCTGGLNYHGRYEYACVESLESCVEILKNIAALYAE